MHDLPMASNVCSQIGHIVSITVTVRCLHTMATWTTAEVHVDQADDIQAQLFNERLDFGPFDDDLEILRMSRTQHEMALRHLLVRE